VRGAPKGNRNALKHGRHTAPFQARRARVRALIASTRNLIRRIEMAAASRRALAALKQREGGGGVRGIVQTTIKGLLGFARGVPYLAVARSSPLKERLPPGYLTGLLLKNKKQPKVQNGRSFPVQEHHAPQGARR
jgi:hypothetical protein